MESQGATLEELELLTLGGLRKAVVDGDVNNGSVMAGQIAGLVREECTCKELLEKLITDMKETFALVKEKFDYE